MSTADHHKSKEKTLFWGMAIGIIACFVTFYGFYIGKTTIQLIDLIKRIIEILSVIFAYYISLKYKNHNNVVFRKAEQISGNIVSVVMLITAILLSVVMYFKFQNGKMDGNVIFGICIAAGDLFMNSGFLIKYIKLSRGIASKVVSSQKHFYTMKVLSNSTVLLSLLLILFVNNTISAKYIDIVASCMLICISIYISIQNLIKNNTGSSAVLT